MSDGINLRPWRDERRQLRQTQFAYLAVITLLLGMLLSGWWWWTSSQSIAAVQQENQLIQQELNVLNNQIKEVTALREKREQLLKRIELIQELQQQRPQTTTILDQLAASMVEGIYLDSLRREANQLSIQGQAAPSQKLSDWMRSLKTKQRFNEPVLRSVTADDETEISRFDLLLPLSGN